MEFRACYLLLLLLLTHFQGHNSYEVEVSKINLLRHLITAFSFMRHHNKPDDKEISRKYIETYLKKVLPNAFHEKQIFNGTILGEEVPSINYISIIPGSRWGTNEDQVSVFLNHYDTQPTTPGVSDNGSGVAMTLELARILGDLWSRYDHSCLRLNSVILAIVDIEENGIVGSKHFADNWLVPFILERYNIGPDVFAGVVVTDNILNYEDYEGANYPMPPALDQEVPSYNILNGQNNFKGDYLASFIRTDDMNINNFIQDVWGSVNGHGLDKKYKYFTFQLPITGSINKLSDERKKLYFDLFRSDHRNFWNHTSTLYPEGIPTVFLCDTVYFRGFMHECYHKDCDDLDHLTEANWDFLKVNTDALTRVAIALQSGNKPLTCLNTRVYDKREQ